MAKGELAHGGEATNKRRICMQRERPYVFTSPFHMYVSSRPFRQTHVFTRSKKVSLQNLASTFLDLLPPTSIHRPRPCPALLLDSDSSDDRELEDLVHTLHFLAAAFDVYGAHSVGDSLTLLWRYGSQALRFEEVDAGSLCSEVGFETDEDEGSCRAEVEDFGVPLLRR